MQVMLIVRRTFCSEKSIRAAIRRKTTRTEIAKRIQKENNALFGSLIETKKQKLAREKREKKGKFLSENKSSSSRSKNDEKSQTNPELLWVSRMKGKNLTQIILKKNPLPFHTKTTLKYNDDDDVDDDSSTNFDDSREENKETKPHLPLDVLVNNMTMFSYLDGSKDTITSDEGGEPQTISANDDESKLSIPSVTRILNKTMSKTSKLNLELWKQKMILKLGVEGFETYNQELLLNGKQFHSAVQNYLIQKQFDVPKAVEKSWQSVQHVLKDVNDVRVIESHVVHEKLFYRGIVDCVAYYKGNLCVIDWKKSDKPKLTVESTYDAPIQVASYIGAINADRNYKFQVCNGLVVVAYTNGDPATIHEVNPSLLNKYWKFWLRRLQQYYLDLQTS